MGINHRLRNEKGLTLIEVLAGIVILMIVLGIGMAALSQSSTVTNAIKGESQERQDMQTGLLQLTKMVQEASKVVVEGEYNFQLVDANGVETRFWLDNGQLNTNDKNGLEPIEGIRKMTVVDGKGITLEINDLEEPVVLAMRSGGLEIETELGAEEEDNWADRDPDVVCLKNEKDFSKYPQMLEAEKKGIIRCDMNNGFLHVKYKNKLNLTGGDITIKTNKLDIEQEAHFSLSNGSIYLQIGSIDIGYLSSTSSSENYHIAKDLNTYSNEAKLVSGENIVVLGTLYSSFKARIVSDNGSIFIRGDVIDTNDSGTLSSAKSITILGDVTSNYISNIASGDSIFIKGNLTNSKDRLTVSSVQDLTILGDVINKFETKYSIGRSLYIRGNLDNQKDQSNIEVQGNIVIRGDVYNRYQAKMKSGGSIFIEGNLINKLGDVDINSMSDLVVKGDIVNNEEKVKIHSGNTIFISGFFNTNRLGRITSDNKIYIQNGINVGVGSVVTAKSDIFVNGIITFPSDPFDTQGATLTSNQLLTYTGPIKGAENDNNNRTLLKGSPLKHVASIDTLPSFPTFPEFPTQPTQP